VTVILFANPDCIESGKTRDAIRSLAHLERRREYGSAGRDLTLKNSYFVFDKSKAPERA